MSDETPIPWADNVPAQQVFHRLRVLGPQSTVDLQAHLPLVHVARQVWELRHWYGIRILTRRLPNRVALYQLDSGVPEAAAVIPPVAAASRSPEFGDVNLIRSMRPKGRRR